ncbi:uncharacterized protein LOC126898867 isoform X2 [Daktulosphaira vitifoliae]|uniref:uncharacterized protein LOC126898867 isoform X2 n=1 Tax=Daktulosphaira vitifoliae TaxID=58002 RepID=UPI0021AAA807|nr:uncharacterized protein LOC126898867 isoform X2 [Daktulosphaira vitifoliae]
MTSKSIDVKTFYGIQTRERTWIHLKTFCNIQDCEQIKNITTSKKMFFTRKRTIKKYDHIEKYKNMSKSAILHIPLLKVPKSQNEHIINQISWQFFDVISYCCCCKKKIIT